MSTRSDWAGVVEDVRRALTPRGRAQLGQFPVEGFRLIERAVRAGHPPRRVILSERLLRQREPRLAELLTQLEQARCSMTAVPEGVMLELAEGRNGGLIIALCDALVPPTLEQVRARALEGGGPVLVLADVEEPGNVGALVRTGLAAGASAVVTLGNSDAFHPKAVRTSMGSLFKLPVLRLGESHNLRAALAPLRCYAAVAGDGPSPWRVDLSGPLALFVGNEADGLSAELVAQLDGSLCIPMPSGVDSFSVNAAAAILLYESARQRATGAPADA